MYLGLFSLAATKLPSYWLPATPAAGLLIALGALVLYLLVVGQAIGLPMLPWEGVDRAVIPFLGGSFSCGRHGAPRCSGGTRQPGRRPRSASGRR